MLNKYIKWLENGYNYAHYSGIVKGEYICDGNTKLIVLLSDGKFRHMYANQIIEIYDSEPDTI